MSLEKTLRSIGFAGLVFAVLTTVLRDESVVVISGVALVALFVSLALTATAARPSRVAFDLIGLAGVASILLVDETWGIALLALGFLGGLYLEQQARAERLDAS